MLCFVHLSTSWNCISDLILEVWVVVCCNSKNGITQLSTLVETHSGLFSSVLSFLTCPLSQPSSSPYQCEGTFHLGLTENRLYTASPEALPSQQRKPHSVLLCLLYTSTCTAAQKHAYCRLCFSPLRSLLWTAFDLNLNRNLIKYRLSDQRLS